MKSVAKIYTSYVSQDNLNWIVEHNLLPVFLIRSLERTYPFLTQYTNSVLHLRSYSPTSELFHLWRDRKITRSEFIKQYAIELSMLNIPELVRKIESLIDLTKANGIVILEVEKSEDIGHRIILRNIINNSGLLVNKIEELDYEQGGRDTEPSDK